MKGVGDFLGKPQGHSRILADHGFRIPRKESSKL